MGQRRIHVWLPIIISGLVFFSPLIVVLEFDSSETLRDIGAINTEWTLHVGGSVSHPLDLTFNELVSMPASTEYAELYCFGALVASGNWTGVKLRVLLEKAGPNQHAGTVELHAEDGYKITLPFAAAVQENIIVAFKKDGKSLSEKTRLVVPGENGAEWISALTEITIGTVP